MNSLKLIKSKHFANGSVHAMKTHDNFTIEVTDTFLPLYTKFSTNSNSNQLLDSNFGDRSERWMIGVSTMAGCPVKCKFCATSSMPYRKLTAQEILDQVLFVTSQNKQDFQNAKEHKINYTRMGEPFLNINEVKNAISLVDSIFPNTHHYVSTIGIQNSDFSWISNNISLQISLHSLNEQRRNALIPIKNKLSIEQLGQIRTKSFLKTTVNLTLVSLDDFDSKKLKSLFDPNHFFIKVSPINPNPISIKNNLGNGIIQLRNNHEQQ